MCFLHLPTRHPSAFPRLNSRPRCKPLGRSCPSGSCTRAPRTGSCRKFYWRRLGGIPAATARRTAARDGERARRGPRARPRRPRPRASRRRFGRFANPRAASPFPRRGFTPSGEASPGGRRCPGSPAARAAITRASARRRGKSARRGARSHRVARGGVNDRDGGVPPGEDQVAASTSGGQVMEGNMINRDVTAPGATLALGLMFMRTDDEGVAAHLTVPNTHFALEHARPDFILLRVVAHSLVMWNSIRPTMEWVLSNLPPLLRVSLEPPRDLEASLRAMEDLGGGRAGGAVDREASRRPTCTRWRARAHGGSAIRGNGGRDRGGALREMTLRFVRLKSQCKDGKDGLGALIDRPTLETCVGLAAVALSCVMAGTRGARLAPAATPRLAPHVWTPCDGAPRRRGCSSARRRRRPRRRPAAAAPPPSPGGAHMAIGMAIGFLVPRRRDRRTFATDNGLPPLLLVTHVPAAFPRRRASCAATCRRFGTSCALAARSDCPADGGRRDAEAGVRPVGLTVRGRHTSSPRRV